MTFEDAALTRLRRYRGESDASLRNLREAEDAARAFSRRLFGATPPAALAAMRMRMRASLGGPHPRTAEA